MEKPKLTPKDFFLYLGAMATLYWSAGSFVALLFAIVDAVFQDELQYYVDLYSGGIRFAIASLVVIFPISLLLFRAIKKDALAHPEKFLLPLRRWLFAVTMFVTAATLAGDVIALLNSFLGGELTTRFALKVVAVFVVAGITFWYCLLEIRVRPDSPARVRAEFLWNAPLLVLAAIVYGFTVMGSPATIRKLRFDDERVSALQTIQWQVVSFWQQKGKLPEALAGLDDPITGFKTPMDPVTKAPYEYKVNGKTAFTLCAAFAEASPKRGISVIPYAPGGFGGTWEHAQGRTCFDRTLDPELYPVRPKGF